MSGAMSTVFQRLLARKQKLKELIPSLTKSATPSSTSSPLPSTSSTGETTTYKKDRQNALSVKDERTADDPAGGLKENMPDSTTYPITSKISEQARTEPPAEKRARMEQEEQEEMSIQALLAAPSTKEKESKKISNEILELLNKPTAKELQLLQKFKSDGSSMQEFCVHGTRQDCARVCGRPKSCDKLHFKKIIQRHTDVSLGDCSFLNTCFHMDTCKYIHYQVDYSTVKERQSAVAGVGAAGAGASNPESTADHQQPTGPANGHPLLKNRHSSGGSLKSGSEKLSLSEMNPSSSAKLGLLDKTKLSPPQWIQCDLRFFDFSVLGKFSVIMADPPWDIHMELPYGTMADEEMRKLPVHSIQDDGFFFLWVTGRAMELGRECLKLWGYKQIDELIWVKTNQLQRIIRTGRTGHWLNHGKEHCLVGLKGNPKNCHSGLDCNVIVAEVRATSHKPDEIYGIIERLAPGTRKIELFGRMHNVQPNWITLGNQLDGVRLIEQEVVERFNERYPDGNCMPKPEDVLLYKKQQERHNVHKQMGTMNKK